MALRLRGSKDVKRSFYYVWYLGAREAKGVDAMPGAIAYLLERERLKEPFKVTLQVSGTTILRSGFGSVRRKYHGNESTGPHQAKRLIGIPDDTASLLPFSSPVISHVIEQKLSRTRKVAKLRSDSSDFYPRVRRPIESAMETF